MKNKISNEVNGNLKLDDKIELAMNNTELSIDNIIQSLQAIENRICTYKTRGFEFISKKQFEQDFEGLNVKYEDLKLPKRGTSKAAGYDIFSPIDFELKPKEEIKIPTGFKVYMLDDEYIKFCPRSGMGFKYYIRLANTLGIGDSDYYNCESNEGHYFVKLRNEGTKVWSVKKGDGIAQAIFSKYLLADDDSFTGNTRTGGFGSTDK